MSLFGISGLNVFADCDGGGGGSSTGLFPDGGETEPSISFTSDPDTGIYLETPGVLSVSTSGLKRMRVSDEISFSTLTQPQSLIISDALGVTSKKATQIFPVVNGTTFNVLNASGTSVFFVNTNTAQTFITGGSQTEPGLSIGTDQNTGVFSTTPDTLGLSCGGTSRLDITNSSVSVNLPFSPSRVNLKPTIDNISTVINALNPGGNSLIILTSSVATTLNGINSSGVVDGTILYICRIGIGSTLSINHNSGSAAVGDKIICPGGVGGIVKADRSISVFIYVTTFWYMM
jgi:hypothetical protein